MPDADKPIGRLRRPPSPFARHPANRKRPLAADQEVDGLDAPGVDDGDPARGIVLGLAPALLIWAGLIALFVKLLR